MSQAGSERDGGDSAPSAELANVVAELRTELQSIRERELRRESRLVTFDQQVAQMEASLEKEVERLRTTGSAVDLITEHLRIAVRELLGEREHMAGEIDDLRGRIEALGAPDLQPVLTQLDQVSSRLAALPGRELRPLADQLEQLRQQVAAQPPVDLQPIHEQLAALHATVAAIPAQDLSPVVDVLEALPHADLGPLTDTLARIDERLAASNDDQGPERILDQLAMVRDQITAVPPLDLSPLLARMTAIQEQVAAIEPPDLSGLERRLDAVGEVDLEPFAAEIAVLRDGIAAIPAPDLAPLTDEISRLRDGIAAIPAPDLAPLTDEVARLRDGVAGIPAPDLAPLTEEIARLRDGVADITGLDLDPLHQRLDTIRQVLIEGLASLPASLPTVDDSAVREDLSRLNAQVDALRTNLADRFDAIPAPDLAPLLAELAALAERVEAAPTLDLSPIEQRLTKLDQLVAGLPGPDAVAGALAEPLAALRETDRTDEVLQALADATTAVREQVTALPEPSIDVDAAFAPLRADLDGLSSASADVRTDLALVTEVLAALTQLAESSDERLTGLSDAQLAAATEQRTALSQALGELTHTMSSQVQQLESQLVQLVTRTASLDDVQQGFARSREAVAALATKAERAEEATKEQADEHSLALARLTASADSLLTTLGATRASISKAVKASGEATIEAVDERVGTRVEQAVTQALQQAEADRADQLQLALADLGVTQLRRSVADVTAQVVAGRTDARTINESIAALQSTIAEAAGEAVSPVAKALERVRKDIEAMPAPDLGPVAAQLARLSATIVSQARHEAASPADVATLRSSIEESLAAVRDHLSATIASQPSPDAASPADVAALRISIEDAFATVRDQLNAQVETTAQLHASVAGQTGPTEIVEGLRRELAQAQVAMQASLDRISEEVAGAREPAGRRGTSRWRRGSDDDTTRSGRAVPTGPTELEERIDRALQDVDQRLGSLAQLVERAGAFADDAAQAAVATLRVVSAPPPAARAPAAPPPPAAAPTPTKAPAAKKAAAAKKAPAKKKAPVRATKTRAKTTTAKKTATKKATTAKKAAKPADS